MTKTDGKFPKAANRRQFSIPPGWCAVSGMLGLGLGLYAKQSKALPALALRPPGALAEDDFLGACIRCGLCVRLPLRHPRTRQTGNPGDRNALFHGAQHPVRNVRGHSLRQGLSDRGARPRPTDINKAPDGHRRADRPRDLSQLRPALRCLLSHLPGHRQGDHAGDEPNQRTGRRAMFLPTVHSEHCTGCGKCEKSCVLKRRRFAFCRRNWPWVSSANTIASAGKSRRRPTLADRGPEHHRLPTVLPEGATPRSGHYDPASGHSAPARGLARQRGGIIPARPRGWAASHER